MKLRSKPLQGTLPKPARDPDMVSKRGISYWFSPEWCRDLRGTICRIKPIKHRERNGEPEVYLYMLAKSGNLTFIQGSIQQEFRKWHTDRQIDYILLGGDLKELIETQHNKG